MCPASLGTVPTANRSDTYDVCLQPVLSIHLESIWLANSAHNKNLANKDDSQNATITKTGDFPKFLPQPYKYT